MTGGVPAGKATIETGVHDKTAVGIKKIKQRFKKMSASLSRMSQQAALGAASIGAPLVLAAKQFATMGDSLQKASTRTRIQVAELAKLRFAAEQSGVSAKGLEDAIFRMDRRIGNAATGTGPAVRALRELGLEANELSKATPDKKLELLMAALDGVANESIRNQLGFELFGDNFRELVPLLDAGATNLNDLKKEAADLGVAFTGVDAQKQADKAAALKDAFAKLQTQFQAIAAEVGSSLAPVLIRLSKQFTPVIKETVEFIAENKELVIVLASVAAGLATASVAMKAAALTNPFTAAIAGAVVLISHLDTVKKGIDSTVAWSAGITPEEKKDAPNLRALVKSKEFQKTREEVTRNEARDKERKLSPKDFAKTMLERANKAEGTQHFKTMSSRLNSVLKNAASAVANIAENVPQVAAGALGVAGNFLQANALQPALMASTAGGLGAGGALGIGAIGGATTPMQDVSEHTAAMSDGIEMMNEKLADLVGNGLDVQVINTEEIKNG